MGDRAEATNALVVHYLTLRRMLGWIGLWLPVVLMIGGLIERGTFLSSISAYANTAMDDVLTAALSAVGVFLIAYRGYPRRPGEWFSDDVITTAAGVGALGVALFPLAPEFGATDWQKLAEKLHYPSAALFFAGIGTMAFVQFCRSDRPRREWTAAKKRRNAFFRLVGLIIYAATAALVAQHYRLYDFRAELGWTNAVFWFETVGVWAFGIAWLVKGKAVGFFNDPEDAADDAADPGEPPAPQEDADQA